MTIASQTARVSYTGDGATGAFAVPYYFQANSDLVVWLRDPGGNIIPQILGTHYNLVGATVSSGGFCTFVSAPPLNYFITIYRDPLLTQTTSYNNNDPFPAKSHELALDKALTIDQRTRDLVNRAVHLSDADSAANMIMPTLEARKGRVAGYSASDGTPIVANNTIATFDLIASGALATSGGFNRIVIVKTYADLLVFTPFAGAVVYLLGNLVDNDGLQGIYTWEPSSTAVVDGSNVIQPTGGVGPGRWIRANVSGATPGTGTAVAAPQGRLTLTPGIAVPIASVSGATTVYWTPFNGGDMVPIFNGTVFVPTRFPETGQDTTDNKKSPAIVAAGGNYDLFGWIDTATVTMTIASPGVVSYANHGLIANAPLSFTTAGSLPTGVTSGTVVYVSATGLTSSAFQISATPGGASIVTSGTQSGVHTATMTRTTRGPVWTNDTTRGYTFTLQNGIALNTSSITNGPAALRGTWLGCIGANGSSTIDLSFGAAGSGGVAAALNVWNAYNRILMGAKITDNVPFVQTPASNAVQNWHNGAGGMRCDFIVGAQGDTNSYSCQSEFILAASSSAIGVLGIGFDSPSAFSDVRQRTQYPTVGQSLCAAGMWQSPFGRHTFFMNQQGDGVVATNQFNNTGSATFACGIWM